MTTEIGRDVPLASTLLINCTTDLSWTTLAWMDGDGQVLVNTSEPYLTLEINRITIAHHNSEYICLVVGPFGNQTKSVTLFVARESSSSSRAIAGAVTAVLVILLLLVVGIVLIVIFAARKYVPNTLMYNNKCNVGLCRLKNKRVGLQWFRESIRYKPRQVSAHSADPSKDDDDYTPAPTKGNKECIELELSDEQKDKDYYFMDTSLLGQSEVDPL